MLRAHVLTLDACHDHGFFHGVSAEGLTKLLIENNLDEGRDAVLLRRRIAAGLLSVQLAFYGHALGAAAFSHPCIAEMQVELSPTKLLSYQRIEFLFSAPTGSSGK